MDDPNLFPGPVDSKMTPLESPSLDVSVGATSLVGAKLPTS